MLPLVFEPYLKSVVWGGRRLEGFGKSLPAGPVGESWEISGHPHHVSVVAEGSFKGQTLNELLRNHGDQLGGPCFPWLIKLLDCNDLLSIQVHPNDDKARQLCGEANGKSEAWVVLEAEPGSRIFAGFKEGTTKEEVFHRLREGTLEHCLHVLTPKRGDCIFLPAGIVHAVGGGVVITEVQQSSDATFRLYDWNRPGLDGKPRPLHIHESLACIDWQARPVAPTPARDVARETLVDCPYFQLTRFRVTDPLESPCEGSVSVWILTEGAADLHVEGYRRRFERGGVALIPSSCAKAVWQPIDSVTLLAVSPCSTAGRN